MEPVYFFDKLNKISLALALFLIPVFFLPFTQNFLVFPKQFLFLFLVFFSLICWLAKQIFQKKIVLRINKLFYISFALILLSFLLSTVFSIWPENSFWGWSGNISDSLLSLILFLVFAFLVANSFEKEGDLLTVLFLLLLSGALVGIFSILQIFGFFILPFSFAKTASFNLIGTIHASAVLFAGLLLISLILAFKAQRYWKIFFSVISVIFLTNIILVDFKSAWIALLFGVSFLSVFGLGAGGRIKFSWIGSMMLLIILSVFFIFFSSPNFPGLPTETSPSFIHEIQVLKGTFSENFKNIFLGTGPGTFIFDFSRFHSVLLNQTPYWGTRFQTGDSLFLDWIITKGLFGALSLIFLYLIIIYFGIKSLKGGEINVKMGVAASIFTLIIASFLYSFNFTFWFLFWFLSGVLLFFGSRSVQIDILSFSRLALMGLIFVAVVISGLFLLFLEGKSYLAEIEYLKGMKISQEGENDLAIESLNKAKILNPSLDFYWRDLAQLYLTKANLISQGQDLSIEENRKLTQQVIRDGIDNLNRAITIAPFNVANWNVRGFFYRNLIGISGAGELAIESYRRAAELEPVSPFSYGEQGRVYVLIAQDFAAKGDETAKEEALSMAVERLKKSLELKADYAPAYYLLAVAYDQQGKTEEAVKKLEELKNITPNDAGVAFQLGVLYWRREELNKARDEFDRAVGSNSDYSNARYMLGLVYDKIGEKEKAKEQFEIVVQLNPENQEVKNILENLNQGLPALEGIVPTQLPLGETPAEIEK